MEILPTKKLHVPLTDLGGGDEYYFNAVVAQGVSTQHILRVFEDGTMVYMHIPDGGPVNGLKRFAETPRDWDAWEPKKDAGDNFMLQMLLSEQVLRKAHEEVLQEMGMGVV